MDFKVLQKRVRVCIPFRAFTLTDLIERGGSASVSEPTVSAPGRRGETVGQEAILACRRLIINDFGTLPHAVCSAGCPRLQGRRWYRKKYLIDTIQCQKVYY